MLHRSTPTIAQGPLRGRPRRARRGLVAATALSAAAVALLSGCIPLPLLVPPQPAPVTTPPPTAPIPSPTQPTPTQPSPTPMASPYGPLFGGNEPESDSGVAVDPPVDLRIEPSRGTPLLQEGSPFGDWSTGDTFRADADPAAGTDLLLTATGRLTTTHEDGNVTGCTATVVHSATGTVAVTAAHCMQHARTRSQPATIEFVPGDRYLGGSRPFGTWYADRWWAPQAFLDTAVFDGTSTTGDGWANDVAFVTFPPHEGTPIEAYTGGQGLSFTGEAHGALVLGYPSLAPYDGQWLRGCSAERLGFGETYWPHYTMPCAMTGGASGGPWITNVDPQTGAGYVIAVTSTVGGTISGAPLGASARNAYEITQ